MKKIYYEAFASWAIILCLIFFHTLQVHAQNVNGVQQQVLRVKFKKNFADKIEKSKKQKTAEGFVQTGLSPVDKLNKQHKVTSLKRVFRPAGKFEAKHRKWGLHQWYELQLAEGTSTLDAIKSFAKLADVEQAEGVYEKTIGVESMVHKEATAAVFDPLPNPPNDPQLNTQWHYNNTGQGGGTPGADISLFDAWQSETGDPGVIVAVTDGGIDVSHSDITANMWINTGEIPGNGLDDDNNGFVDDVYGYNFGDNNGNIPADDHGTHVGGTVAGVTNNGVGVAGVAGGSGNGTDGARLMSLSAFGAVGVGGFDETYIYAADNGAVISQNSWGYTNPGVFEQSVLDAIDYFIAEAGYDENGNPRGPMQGGIVIFAAGNSGSNNNWYPGFYEPVLAVAGSDRNDTRYTSSNFGPWVEITAPAVGVVSTVPGNSYASFNGTSMACPHVSGVAALIISKFAGNITPQQVWDRLVETTDKVATMPDGFGSGRLNAFNALQEDDGQAPEAITDLAVTDAFQTALQLSWTAPADPGNGKASSYEMRYATEPITAANFNEAMLVSDMPPAAGAGEVQSHTVTGLAPTTTYYFALKAIDFFGNASPISNTASGTTENAPVISVTPGSFEVTIDAATNPVATRTLSITNEGTGAALDFNLSSNLVSQSQTRLLFPGNGLQSVDLTKYGKGSKANASEQLANKGLKKSVGGVSTFLNASDSIYYDAGDATAEDFSGLIGGGYTSAVRFEVEQPSFSLTHVRNFLRTEFSSSPTIIVEVYRGSDIAAAELLLSQEVQLESTEGEFFIIPLEQAQNFTAGDVFWVVNKYPLDIEFPQGVDTDIAQRPNTFFFSGDGGFSFSPSGFVFKVRALSASGASADWLSFDPASGSVESGQTVDVTVSFDAQNVANGNYLFNILVNSDDPNTPTVSVPAAVEVSGQLPGIAVDSELLEFGSVFVGAQKALPVLIKNEGLGALVIEEINTSHPAYTTDLSSLNLAPGEEATLMVIFAPNDLGNINATLNLITNDPDYTSVQVALVGTGTAPPVIGVNPEQISTTLDAGETGTETITISNTGNYPLQFSFPDFAAQSLLTNPAVKKNNTSPLDLPKQSQTQEKGGPEPMGHPVVLGAGADLDFGYTWIDSDTEGGPAFIWEDISETGTEILPDSDDGAVEIDLPFNLKFYGETKNSILITANGYLTFGTDGNSWMNSQLPDASEPNDLIAPYWDDLRPFGNTGKVFYTLNTEGLTVQYHEVGSYADAGTATFQVKVQPSGRIYFYYKEMSTLASSSSATIGIENAAGTDGAQVVYNNSYVKDNLAVVIMPPAPEFISSVSRLSGIVPVGGNTTVTVTLDARELFDGTYRQDLIIESNDPVNSALAVPFTLTVIGTPEIAVNPGSLAFDSLFVGLDKTLGISIQNTGSKEMTVSSISAAGGAFTVDFDGPVTIEPESSIRVPVTFTPASAGAAEAVLIIVSDGSDSPVEVALTGIGVDPPVISVMPEEINAQAASGELAYDTLLISNSGSYRLDYTIAGTYWFKPKDAVVTSAETLAASESLPAKGEPDLRKGTPVRYVGGNDEAFGYTWEDNKDRGGPDFEWTDITGSGTDITESLNNGSFADGAVEVPIGFGFNFYGSRHQTVFVSASGILYFGEQPGSTFTNERIPVSEGINNLIAGFWDDLEPGTVSGTVHYKANAEHFVVQFTNVGAYGSDREGSVTFQIILYADGKIRMLYQDVETANFLNASTVGIENAAGTDGIEVVFNSAYIVNGLAIEFTAPATGSVAPGQSVKVPIVLDARSLPDGTYTDEVTVNSNDVVNPLIIIPVTLVTSGMPEIEVSPATLEFGSVYVHQDSVFTATQQVMVKNTGYKALTVSAVYTTNPDAFTVAFEAPLVIAPNEEAALDVTFAPTTLGILEAGLVFESDDASDEQYTISLMGEGVEPPVFTASTAGDTITAVLKSTETGVDIINISNSGNSLLEYSARVSYLLGGFSNSNVQASVKPLARPSSAPVARAGVKAVRAGVSKVPASDIDFTDSISYDTGNIADDFVGIPDPSIPFASATRFVSPEAGFTLSHVRNFYRTEGSTESIIMSVYAGGTDPATATEIASQEVSGGSAEGDFELISLNEPIAFAPGETFWVVFFYPTSMIFSQGVNFDVTGVEGIFWYSGDQGLSWAPFDGDLPNTAAKVRALQSSREWISLDPESGTLAAGSTDEVRVIMDATQLDAGEYFARVNFSSNDPFNRNTSIPVRVRINSLPQFVDYPADTLRVNEGSQLVFEVKAADTDGQIMEYNLQESYDNVNFSYTAAAARVSFKPAYDQSGIYTFTVEATDDLGEVNQVKVVVRVTDQNRAPYITSQIKSKNLKAGKSETVNLGNYFRDPDNDPLTFTANASNPGIVGLAVSGNMLQLTGLSAGNTFVTVNVSDGKGGSTASSFQVKVTGGKKVKKSSATAAVAADDDTSRVTLLNSGELVNYPNPFRGETTISYQLEEAAQVKLQVLTILGIPVTTLAEGVQHAGRHQFTFDASQLPAGIYLYRLQVADKVTTKRMVVK
ncbi:choice-of-anchor D domain-containing protein [Cesiribacter sp. SM1]|uniref:Ig-like domain-containing protein n=1 Tax=Cesiribacter sp. SM1 TaxID=2861196 RepID=UPI001CD38C57|nr:choice-of-anchor D domain-containing protein [Cesiribacter sp. SM1]